MSEKESVKYQQVKKLLLSMAAKQAISSVIKYQSANEDVVDTEYALLPPGQVHVYIDIGADPEKTISFLQSVASEIQEKLKCNRVTMKDICCLKTEPLIQESPLPF